MKHFIFFFLIFNSVFQAKAQEYREVQFSDVEELLKISNDTLYVIDFWATWCKPCVEELPYFEKMYENYKDHKLKIILISLDFQSQVETKFKPFLRERNLKNEVWFLNESKFNKFIPVVDDNWSGAIPFTLFFRGKDNFRFSKEGAFESGELEEIFKNKFDN